MPPIIAARKASFSSVLAAALPHVAMIPSIVELPSFMAAPRQIRLPYLAPEVAESPVEQGPDQRGNQTYGRHAVRGIKEYGAVQVVNPMIFHPCAATALADFGLELLDLCRCLLFGLVIACKDTANRDQMRREVRRENSLADVPVRDLLEASSSVVTQELQVLLIRNCGIVFAHGRLLRRPCLFGESLDSLKECAIPFRARRGYQSNSGRIRLRAATATISPRQTGRKSWS